MFLLLVVVVADDDNARKNVIVREDENDNLESREKGFVVQSEKQNGNGLGGSVAVDDLLTDS